MRFEIARILLVAAVTLASAVPNATPAEPAHDHPTPEKLGTVHFESSCSPAARDRLDERLSLT